MNYIVLTKQEEQASSPSIERDMQIGAQGYVSSQNHIEVRNYDTLVDVL